MMSLRAICLLSCAVLLPMVGSGCKRVMHELHPDRLWRMNRGPAVGAVDSTFSISDDQATARAAEWREIVRSQE